MKKLTLITGSIIGFSYLLLNKHINERIEYFYAPGGLIRGLRAGLAGGLITYKYLRSGINENSHEYAARKLHDCFAKNKGCYIKIGQVLSQLEHILPEAYSTIMEPLMQENQKSEFKEIRSTLESIYKKDLFEVFQSFEENPLGVASLAQVHKAVLKDGSVVAVKVQHKKIYEQSRGDIVLVKFACYFAEKVFKDFKYKWLGIEFETNLPKELNFIFEGKNADKIRNMFKDDDRIIIPKIYWEYTHPKVLVMSYEEGKSITDLDYLKEKKIDLRDVSSLLCQNFYRQIFHFGFVHSDPHPGNVFVRKETINGKEKLRLVLLDHGLYREYDDFFRYNYCNLWRAVFNQDANLLSECCKNLNVSNPQLFVAMLFSKKFDSVFDKDEKFNAKARLGNVENKSEKESVKEYAVMYHKEITQILGSVRSEMLLLLKIKDFLNAIDRRIGSPINNFKIMYETITEEIAQFEWKSENFSKIIKVRYEYFVFNFFMNFVDLYLKISSLRGPAL